MLCSLDKIKCQYLGRLNYLECYDLQLRKHAKIANKNSDGCILMVEHDNVLTLGKRGKESNIKYDPDYLRARNIPVHRVERGGDVTAHMPGQLVVYPIVHLGELGLGVRKYIQILEESILKFLATFGIRGESNRYGSGVWVEDRKIASIGVRVKQKTTFHGLALNLRNSSELFEMIHPCGYEHVKTVSVAQHAKIDKKISDLAHDFAKILGAELGFHDVIFAEGLIEEQRLPTAEVMI